MYTVPRVGEVAIGGGHFGQHLMVINPHRIKIFPKPKLIQIKRSEHMTIYNIYEFQE